MASKALPATIFIFAKRQRNNNLVYIAKAKNIFGEALCGIPGGLFIIDWFSSMWYSINNKFATYMYLAQGASSGKSEN